MNLIYKVKKIIEKEKLIKEGDCILVGVSGGIDSTALLYVLSEISKQIEFKLGIGHLNHQLRGEESERDERFVEELAGKFFFPFYIKRADVKAYALEHKLSIQHAGRDLRYDFFEAIASQHGFNKIAVAHNLDDRIETFLLRILKGTGIRGLSSIPVKRGSIIRPFFDIYRIEIEDYVKRKSITYVMDSSNDKIIYERNYIRKQIIPLMNRVNPLFKEKIILLLQDLTATSDAYDEKAEDFLKKEKKTEGGDVSLEIDALKRVDEEVRFRAMANIFGQIKSDFMPFREHMRLINKILTSERPNLMLSMPSGIKVKKIYNKLVFTKKPPGQMITGVYPVKTGKNRLDSFGITLDVSIIRKGENIEYPTDKNIVYIGGDSVKDLSIRTFLDGDRFFPLGMKDSVKLKDFFISQKTPREKRRHIPLLLSGDDIIWVIGYRIDERFKVTEETKKILKIMAVAE